MTFPDLKRILAEDALSHRDVTFTYTGVPKPSVENISFKLEPGQLAVVVGINGGGARVFLPTAPCLAKLTPFSLDKENQP